MQKEMPKAILLPHYAGEKLPKIPSIVGEIKIDPSFKRWDKRLFLRDHNGQVILEVMVGAQKFK